MFREERRIRENSYDMLNLKQGRILLGKYERATIIGVEIFPREIVYNIGFVRAISDNKINNDELETIIKSVISNNPENFYDPNNNINIIPTEMYMHFNFRNTRYVEIINSRENNMSLSYSLVRKEGFVLGKKDALGKVAKKKLSQMLLDFEFRQGPFKNMECLY